MLYAEVPPPNGDSAGSGRWAGLWEKEEAMVGPFLLLTSVFILVPHLPSEVSLLNTFLRGW